ELVEQSRLIDPPLTHHRCTSGFNDQSESVTSPHANCQRGPFSTKSALSGRQTAQWENALTSGRVGAVRANSFVSRTLRGTMGWIKSQNARRRFQAVWSGAGQVLHAAKWPFGRWPGKTAFDPLDRAPPSGTSEDFPFLTPLGRRLKNV
ncbi:hypothetical protein, partial [Brevundimonas sp. BAL450]|uniref:hypothetical protein n=1 Tax=Brevundimonas sp. BAL450 TaxID=1708162 RepID=UPI001E51607F